MADDQEAEDERETELTTITAIYPELELDPKDCYAASIKIPVTPTDPRTVRFAKAEVEGIPSVETSPIISHFPPLKLSIRLPRGYPADVGPDVGLVSESGWLGAEKLRDLEAQAHVLWEDIGRGEVIFTYIDYLQQRAEEGFELPQEIELAPELEAPLLDFDLRAKRAKFENETFACGVCLEPKKGALCHKLKLCGHVFCLSCLRDYFNNCISEGDVANVKCMDPTCGKEGGAKSGKKKKSNRTLQPGELLEMSIDQAQVQRYVRLKRKKELESNKSTVYCPRSWCQGEVRITAKDNQKKGADDDDDDEDEEETGRLPPPKDRLAICTECTFAFCIVCRNGWHGEMVYCTPPRVTGELTEEEKASLAYLNKHSAGCPTCAARCQKVMGCNHMICRLCDTHFCYLCGAWLDARNPYPHFNTKGGSCYQKLWELSEGDGVGDGNADADQLPLPADIPPEIPDEVPDEPPAQRPARRQAGNPPRAANARQGWQNNGIRINRRVAEGLARPEQLPERANPQNGLQRFLEMALNDEEDGWDSDEMSDSGEWEIPVRAR